MTLENTVDGQFCLKVGSLYNRHIFLSRKGIKFFKIGKGMKIKISFGNWKESMLSKMVKQ